VERAREQGRVTLNDLLGSRPPVVLLRMDCEGGEVKVLPCATPSSDRAKEALELLRRFVEQRFKDGRRNFTDDEWAELIGDQEQETRPGKRLTLLLRLAVKAGEKASLGEGKGATFTPNDIGLERFANKFAALPDGTPFSIRLLLLDERGKNKSGKDGGYFARLPRAVTFLALERALQREERVEKPEAVSDYAFCPSLRDELEKLLGAEQELPGEEDVQRLREWLTRNGLGDRFPNQRERKRKYERMRQEREATSARASGPGEGPSPAPHSEESVG
jgi:hypothetical protein